MKRPGRLEITTKIGCSCNCVYCPQELLTKKYFGRDGVQNPDRELSLENFKKCIDKLPKGTRVDFSGMCEPWLNKQCTSMVKYAYEKGLPIAIYTTLVGMREADFEEIKDIPFEEFVLHIPDDKSNAHINVTEDYINLLKRVIEYENNGSRIVTGYSCHAGIHPDIVDAIPQNGKLITELIDRAGNLTSEYVESKENIGKIVCINCNADIHHNVLLPDGTIVLCCMDYGMKHVLGNLLYQDYMELFETVEAKNVIDGLKNEYADTLCRKCCNARNIQELYEDYYAYKTWTDKLLQKQKRQEKDVVEYKKWVENLEHLNKDIKRELDGLNDRYNDRMKELHDYVSWVKNLEEQIEEIKKV